MANGQQMEFHLSALSQGSLGLKTVYEKDGELRFEPIVGWVVTHSKHLGADAPPAMHQLQPVVVLNDFPRPALIGIDGCLGTVKDDTTIEDVTRRLADIREQQKKANDAAAAAGTPPPSNLLHLFGRPSNDGGPGKD